jgi:hypothetical protein
VTGYALKLTFSHTDYRTSHFFLSRNPRPSLIWEAASRQWRRGQGNRFAAGERRGKGGKGEGEGKRKREGGIASIKINSWVRPRIRKIQTHTNTHKIHTRRTPIAST